MKTRMNIALDWDGTASQDPEGFAQFAAMMRARGHRIFICTMRHAIEEPICHQLLQLFPPNMEVYYTGRKAKAAYCERLGIKVDVWIDDKPYFLYQNG